MANFTGTLDEFEKFIGPRLRNIVQTSIARKFKREKGKCEHCNSKKNLEAAHVHGNDRKKIIRDSLKGLIVDNQISAVDLNAFEKRFVELHYPLNKVFTILCKSCHSAYDKVTESFITENVEEASEPITRENVDSNAKELLGIQFFPSDIMEFKELLIESKSAYISIFYNNGEKEIKEWNASNITEKSNLIGNLRSRQEFRQGNWQVLNIQRIEVSINEDAAMDTK